MKPQIQIAATMGDPSSIGPQVAAKALLNIDWSSSFKINLIGSTSAFEKYISKSDLKNLRDMGKLQIFDLNPRSSFEAGKGDQNSGKRALEDLKYAVHFVQENKMKALVTGPVDKYLCSLNDAQFKGQTEYIRDLSGARSVTMMLASSHLRVALATTHLALREVSGALSPEKIIQTTEAFHNYLRVFLKEVHIAVCALNPHASDNGLFGDEEEKIIAPAIRHLRKKGLNISGPFPADSLFYRSAEYDGIVCMYHDQGLIPLKMQDFYEAVNISLGLDFLRVSVDHGTAFDLVGSENVSSLSYQRAIEQALAWSERSSKED